MSEAEIKRLISAAMVRVDLMDRDDAANGWARPQDLGDKEVMTTAVLAITSGMTGGDWSTVAEAAVMLARAAGREDLLAT